MHLTSCFPVVILHHCNNTILGIQFSSVPCQAKLRYDPIELDPEDMCRMASEQPQVRMCMAKNLLLIFYVCECQSIPLIEIFIGT